MVTDFVPAYRKAAETGVLGRRAAAARRMLSGCALCPRRCRVDRTNGETGVCRTGRRAWVSSCSPHFGEESPLVGSGGSGTVFFTHCNLGCNFCQNADISHGGHGSPVSDRRLAEFMLALQAAGCHNINFVTPTHVVPQILSALATAVDDGLRVPLVYNTSAYDGVETLRLLDGVIDIYMPDFKFWDPRVAEETCGAPDYPEAARAAIREMHRQVGDLAIGGDGTATRGLLVRHLVMPEGLAGTRDIMHFIAREISPDTYVNIMPQYRPCGQAARVEALSRPVTAAEFTGALSMAQAEGITRLDPPRRTFWIA